MRRIPGSLFVLFLLVTAIAARAEEAPSFTLGEALRNSRLIADFRLRFEQVDDDAFTRPAAATTLRSAVGFETGEFRGWQVRLELEDVSVVGADEYANGGFGSANNGVLGRPLIGDPDGTAIHRAFVRWQGHGITVQAGRDELLFGDQRFVGNVGWRQHGQSFDGLSVRAPLGAQWKLSYAFLESVQRINRATDELSGHLLALEGDLGGAGKLLLHAERLDYESPARRALSAPQVRLESARKGQFNTPLATLHKFNGWADRFTATPIDGLDDRYLQLDGQRGAWSWTLAAHDFAAGTGGASYGRELDLQLLWRPKSGLTFGAKSARYDARRYGAETTKLWVWTAFSL